MNKRKDPAWLSAHVKEKAANLTDGQVRDLSALMLYMNPDSEDVVTSTPKFAALGGEVYQSRNCGACHSLNGVGGKIGPPMNGLARRRTEAWTRDHFGDPNKFSKGSIMPPYKFTTDEMQNELSYLFTLPDSPAQ